MVWKRVACSEVGISHQKQEMPCQDYGDYRIFDDVIVGAVADGAGSAKYSDIGAKLTVEKVVECLYIQDFKEAIILPIPTKYQDEEKHSQTCDFNCRNDKKAKKIFE